MMDPILPGLSSEPAILLDERRRPDFRDVFGALVGRSADVAIAITRVRLSTVDLSELELGRLESFRVLVAELNAIQLDAEARTIQADPRRAAGADLLCALLESETLEVRSAPLAGWSPDFTVFSDATGPAAVLSGEQILEGQRAVRSMPVADHVMRYAEKLGRVTRPGSEEALALCKQWLSWGAGPRAGLNLILAAKAHALLRGQNYVSCENVAAVAAPIFRHRIITNFAAQSEGLSADDIILKILAEVPKTEKLD